MDAAYFSRRGTAAKSDRKDCLLALQQLARRTLPNPKTQAIFLKTANRPSESLEASMIQLKRQSVVNWVVCIIVTVLRVNLNREERGHQNGG
jgi:hypothetical protein